MGVWTKQLENVDNTIQGEEIEGKIKECQRENGACMKLTSRNLREKYSDKQVDRVLSRLSARRYRSNKYQQKGTNEIMKLFKQLMTKKVNQEQYSV